MTDKANKTDTTERWENHFIPTDLREGGLILDGGGGAAREEGRESEVLRVGHHCRGVTHRLHQVPRTRHGT